jgi:hypothetical protein
MSWALVAHEFAVSNMVDLGRDIRGSLQLQRLTIARCERVVERKMLVDRHDDFLN